MIRIGSLFAGYGGLDLAVEAVLPAARPVWFSEIAPGPSRVLAHRYPGIPNLGDVTAIDWTAVEPVHVLTGGFPCQDVSLAGARRGLRPDTRSGLWTHYAYAIEQLRPRLVVIENVRGLLSARAASSLESDPWRLGDEQDVPLRALGAVLGSLADLGYDASWQGLRASDVGAPHERFRVFVLAWPAGDAPYLAGDDCAATGERQGRPEQARGSSSGITENAEREPRDERGLAAPGQAEGRRARADARRRGRVAAPDSEVEGQGDRGRLQQQRLPAHADAGSRNRGVSSAADADDRHEREIAPGDDLLDGERAPLGWGAVKPARIRGNGVSDRGGAAGELADERGTPAEVEGDRRCVPADAARPGLPDRLCGAPAGSGAGRTAERCGRATTADLASAERGGAEREAPEAATRSTAELGECPSPGDPPGADRIEWGPYGGAVRRWEAVLGRPAPSPHEPGRDGTARLAPEFVEWMMGLPAGWVTAVPGLSRPEQIKALGNGVCPQQAAEALRLLLPDVGSATIDVA